MNSTQDRPEGDAPTKDCDPNCLCCKGGLAETWLTNTGCWEPQSCGMCGGYPERPPLYRALLAERLKELKACMSAYKAQRRLNDPLRTFTLHRAQGILQDMLALEAGRATREAVAQSEQLDANAIPAHEEP